MKNRSLPLASAALVLALGASAANAATVSFSFSNPLQLTEINQLGTLGFFDSNLGALTAVSLTLNGGSATNLTLTNTAAQALTSRATATTDLFLGSSFASLNLILGSANPVISLSGTTGFVTLAAGAGALFGPLTDSRSRTLTSGAELGGIASSFALAGGGSFDISCISISGLAIQGGGGNIRTTQATQAECSADVVYTYTPNVVNPENPVPAPASLGLLGAALAGLSFARRNAKRG